MIADDFFKTQGHAAAEPRDKPTGGMTADQHQAIREHAARGGEPVLVDHGDIVRLETPPAQPGGPSTPPPPPPPPAAYTPPRPPRGRG